MTKPNLMEDEDEEEWVVVEKRIITIIIPPPSPPEYSEVKTRTDSRKAAETKRLRKHSNDETQIYTSDRCNGPFVGPLRLVNRRLRAMNLERKLQGLGGMKRWLLSQGLGKFVSPLEREGIVGNHQLANLTMKMLKDMGTDAVGPRRKLIHALDTLCQPYYFKPLQ